MEQETKQTIKGFLKSVLGIAILIILSWLYGVAGTILFFAGWIIYILIEDKYNPKKPTIY